MDIKMQYSRDELLELCQKAIVPEEQWRNRDSPSAQEQLGICHHLLKCGCTFYILTIGDTATNDRTIWLSIEWKSFASFEYGEGHRQDRRFYLPTEQRLKDTEGKDWY